jgi:hypothetical protein
LIVWIDIGYWNVGMEAEICTLILIVVGNINITGEDMRECIKKARFYKHRPFQWLANPHQVMAFDDDFYHRNTGIDRLGRKWSHITLRGETVMLHREANQTDGLKIRQLSKKKHIYDEEGTIL